MIDQPKKQKEPRKKVFITTDEHGTVKSIFKTDARNGVFSFPTVEGRTFDVSKNDLARELVIDNFEIKNNTLIKKEGVKVGRKNESSSLID